MRKIHIITSADGSANYISYLPFAIASYKKIAGIYCEFVLHLAVIDGEISNLQKLSLNNLGIEIHYIEKVIGVDPRVQAKCNRLWLAQMPEFSDELLVITDLDMINLNARVFKILLTCSTNEIIKWGFDHPSYKWGEEFGKWPMDKTTAFGKIFHNIVNPNNYSIQKLFLSWSKVSQEKRANPFNHFDNFSDESLLRDLLARRISSVKSRQISRSSLEKKMLAGRVDRNRKTPENQLGKILYKTRIDLIVKVSSDFYRLACKDIFEYHGSRPFPFSSPNGRILRRRFLINKKSYNSFMKNFG